MSNLFENIAKLVPDGEAAFEPEIVGEGVWLTATHLQAIEATLITNAIDISVKEEALESTTILLDAAKQEIETTAATVADATEKVTALTTEVEALKARTALPIAPPAPLANDDLAPKPETLATAQTKWDLELKQQAEKLK